MRNDTALIYRHQLFKTSEPFIRLQASHLKKFTPLYAGRTLENDPVETDDFCVIDTASFWGRISNRLWCNPRPFLDVLGERRPAVVHAHFGLDGVYAVRLTQKLGIPLIVTLHGFDVTVGRLGFAFSGKPTQINYALRARRLGTYASKIICVSDFVRHRAIEYGIREDVLTTHYVGIDVNEIEVGSTKPGLPKRILHVARLVEKKGTLYLLRAIANIVSNGFADFHLDIVGEGPLRTSLENAASQLGISHFVTFHGARQRSEVLALMSSAYVFCLPSVTAKSGDCEGLGMVLLEAGAAGVPCVATHHGGIPEVITDSVNGLLVLERDHVDLANALERLMRDSGLRAALSGNARKVIEERFNVAKQTESLEDLYALARKGR
jgi:colanic acid/amylovoran biosynthesis glycosyltransferase